jgi:hypothetical protein
LVEADDCCNGDRDTELSGDIKEGFLCLLQVFLGVFGDPELLELLSEPEGNDKERSEEYREGHLEDVGHLDL